MFWFSPYKTKQGHLGYFQGGLVLCAVSNDRTRAETCEKSHKKPIELVGARHLSMGQNGAGYPVSVTIKMSDGKEVVYKR